MRPALAAIGELDGVMVGLPELGEGAEAVSTPLEDEAPAVEKESGFLYCRSSTMS